MAELRRAELWNRYSVQGGAERLAVIASVLRCEGRADLASGHAVELETPLADPAVTSLLERQILRLVFSDDTFLEYRISKIRGLHGEPGGVVTITGQDPLLDLGDGGAITETVGGVVKRYDIGLIDVTAEEILDDYILPALVTFGQSYFEKGVVQPTTTISPQFNAQTPLEWLRAIQDLCRDPDTLRPAELRVRLNAGGTAFAIDILTEIGAFEADGVTAVAPADIRYRKNLRTTDRGRDTATQANVVTPLGDPFPDTTPSGIAHAAWRLTLVSGTTYTITDPEGGPSPILRDDFFSNGWYVDPGANLTAIEITSDAVGPPSTITLASSTGITSGGVYEIRHTVLGIYITSLTDDVALGLYGGKHAFTQTPGVVGLRNLAPNAFFKAWTTPTNAPDNWSVFAGLPFADFMTQETSAGFTQFGGKSVKMAQASEIGPVFGVVSPVIYPAALAGDHMFSVKVRVWFETFDGGAEFQVQIRPGGGGDLLYGVTLNPANDPLFTERTDNRPQTGTWVDVIIQDMDLLAHNAAGIQVHIRAGTGYSAGPAFAGEIEAYVAAVQFARHGGPVPPGYYEYSGANALWHAGVRALRANAAPLTKYELDVDDQTRYDNAAFPFDEFLLGRTVNLTNRDLTLYGEPVRIIGIPLIDYLTEKRTQLEVATHAELLAEYLNSQPPNNPGIPTTPQQPPNNPPTQPPQPPTGVAGGGIAVLPIADGSFMTMLLKQPSTATDYWPRQRPWFDATGMGEMRVIADVHAAGAFGAVGFAEYTATPDDAGSWAEPGAGGTEISVPFDQEGPSKGLWTVLDGDAQTDVAWRARARGGDADATPVSGKLHFQFRGVTAPVPPGDDGTPPGDDLGTPIWWSASGDGMWEDDGATVPNDGTNGSDVARWDDKTGNAKHFTNSTGTPSPVLRTTETDPRGRAAIEFQLITGNPSYYRQSPSAVSGRDIVTCYIVKRHFTNNPTVNTDAGVWHYGRRIGSNDAAHPYIGGAQVWESFGQGFHVLLDSSWDMGTYPFDDWHCYAVRSDATVGSSGLMDVFYNGTFVAQRGIIGHTSPNRWPIEVRGDVLGAACYLGRSYSYQGHLWVTEIKCYGHRHTDAQIATASAALLGP